MADFDNLSELNENFDTIKTLLNSIRAQGILNTSDVDKLLSGINSKLEKINTEEDIDLIKIFLSELKQNLDERHSILISKFGAIEALFSNLLKSSSEMPKSSDLKELFDIVATNLSVFSREVVSQKESLTEISLRLDALRSDDTQKREIIKNIAILKSDLDRISNGFDSIVISLNDNFKTVVKTITSIDKTEYLDRFSDSLSSIEMSSNTVLSALQLLGKKSEQVEEALVNLATKDDISTANQRLFEISAQNHEISGYISDMNDRYSRLDSLSEKIDASVNIIATLKGVIEEHENDNARLILEELKLLEAEVKSIIEDTRFEEFKLSLEGVFKKISEGAFEIDSELKSSKEQLQNIASDLKKLDVELATSKVTTSIDNAELNIKNYIDEVSQKSSTVQEAHISRVLGELSNNADDFKSNLSHAHSTLSSLCEKSFVSVYENISDLKTIVSQLDENTVSANNAIFSNITDRLTVFENSLRTSLDTQEKTVNHSSAQLVEQIENLKNLSNIMDYKMDSSVVEVGNIKREFATLKTSIDEILALDFVNVVKDLRVDLYASKQEMINGFDNSSSELSDKLSTDLYGKYELLVSKLDSVEDEFKRVQTESLQLLKPILENISSSIVDVISYVSENKSSSADSLDTKLTGFTNKFNQSIIEFIENVKDVIDVIRDQIDSNLKTIQEENSNNFDLVKKSISENSQDIRKDIKVSYSKLLEIQDAYKELKEIININSISSTDRFDGVLSTAENIKAEFDNKLGQLKNTFIDKITEFKQDFTCENADKVNELKFSVENLYSKGSTEVVALLNELKTGVSGLSVESNNARAAALSKILENFGLLKEHISILENDSLDKFSTKIQDVVKEFTAVKDALEKLDENIDGDITRQLSIVESNFETLMSQITILFDKSELTLSDKINNGFDNVSEVVQNSISEKLEAYKQKIEDSFGKLEKTAVSQSKYFEDSILNLNNLLKSTCANQAVENSKQIEEMATTLKGLLDNNTQISTEQYNEIKSRIAGLVTDTALTNENIVAEVSALIEKLNNAVDAKFDYQEKKIITGFAQSKSYLENVATQEYSKVVELEDTLNNASQNLSQNLDLLTTDISNRFDKVDANVSKQVELAENTQKDLSSLIQLTTNNGEFIGTLENVSKEKLDNITDIARNIQNSLDIVSTNAVNSVDLISSTKNSVSSLAHSVELNKASLAQLEDVVSEKATILKTLVSESSADQLQALDAYVKALQEQIDGTKKGTELCKEAIVQFIQKGLNSISSDIEKETDAIISELVEQFEVLKKTQAGEIVDLTSRIDDIVSSHIADNIEDLKSYLDVRTNDENIVSRIDNLKTELTNSVSDIVLNVSKMLDAGVFSSAISDFRVANEILINTSIDRLNEKVEAFISENLENLSSDVTSMSNVLEDKFNLFDKKFVETLVDKFEEIKDISNECNDSFGQVQNSLNEALNRFDEAKDSINGRIDSLIDTVKESSEATNKEIVALNKSFDDLRSQISNKSFDEAFQASINKQIGELENLITEQLGYIEDINELCANNLPDVTELNALVKHTILESINKFTEKLENVNKDIAEQQNVVSDVSTIVKDISERQNIVDDINSLVHDIAERQNTVDDINAIVQDLDGSISGVISEVAKINSEIIDLNSPISDVHDSVLNIENTLEKEIKELKSDLITQILNVFNQISFVAEQEEILDFIQEKHEELVKVLSHIVTSTNDIYDVKRQVASVDKKINQINDKINSIISSDGEVDYVYSLHDLESDIATLRLELSEIKANDHSKEFSDLIASTNDVYSLVEAIKDELPSKKAFEGLSEDIVSISTRTNKLILASDESYKTLQENLQDFKVVINDLDERTRNFARESGLDRIDTKLNSINKMIQTGSKTNQIFNQVFEYLAEWVDGASSQINTISDKVNSLDDIGQIKTMLTELKSEASDNVETTEMIEALGAVFEKQNKKINMIETKLDRIIVDNAINGDKKMDLKPFEKTLNKFLASIEEKFVSQQEKINSLESKLEGLMTIIEEKDTAQLTKKVGGMDRQIAKLNKSIEKIASHVVEK